MSAERREFQTEVKQLLDLMVHSLYSNKEIFLRELISNASDALDMRRFEGLTDQGLLPDDELHVRLETGTDPRTLTVIDNGIGMSREEVIENLGTIARSGTAEFLRKLSEAKTEDASPELIGQFGVGFYSSFMVAENVTVLTRKAGEEKATRWESTGDGSYEIDDAERPDAGTTITLTLKPVDQEDGLADYTQEWALREVVKKYSDFVAYPIRMKIERSEVERDEQGKEVEGVIPTLTVTDETLNSMKAIWTRPAQDVEDSEYREFYKHIAHDWNEPVARIRARMEGTFEADMLLFIPSKAPYDLHYREMSRRGIQLYVKRVFIMDECKDLMPDYLRFVKGVVDSSDLSLNVSREMLQQDRQISAMRSFLVKKVLDSLAGLKKDEREKYTSFWREFGPALKEGLLGYEDRKEQVLSLVLAESTHHDSDLTSLDEVIERMPESQDTLYYALGTTRQMAEQSPHLEAFRDRETEVIFLTDQVDEVWLQTTSEYNGKKFQSVGKGEVELGSEEEKKEAEEKREELAGEYKDILQCLRSHLQDHVSEVRLSNRLTSSAVCLVGETGDLSPQMEQMLRGIGQDIPTTKRILEVNPDHPILAKLKETFATDPTTPALRSHAQLLYGLATLAEGGTLEDPASFGKLMSEVMVESL